jgi:hypothetical protein
MAPRATDKSKPFTIPKTLAACADLLYSTREERLLLNREAAAKEAIEGQLKNHLIDNLAVGKASGISGMIATVAVDTKPVAIGEDWDAIYLYILYGEDGLKKRIAAHKKKPDVAVMRFCILNKAINQSSVKELWDAKQVVPGINRLNAKTVSITKRKRKGKK